MAIQEMPTKNHKQLMPNGLLAAVELYINASDKKSNSELQTALMLRDLLKNESKTEHYQIHYGAIVNYDNYLYLTVKNDKLFLPLISELYNCIESLDSMPTIENIFESKIYLIDANLKNSYKEERPDDLGEMHYTVYYALKVERMLIEILAKTNSCGWVDIYKEHPDFKLDHAVAITLKKLREETK